MIRRTLLLNANYEVLHFIAEEKKLIKLIYKDKVEIVSKWNEDFLEYGYGLMHFPAVLRLKKECKRRKVTFVFSKDVVFLRDKYICQYCGISLNKKDLTIDHVVPKCLGGLSTFENCATSCKKCNMKKSHKTLERANMTLLNRLSKPLLFIYYFWNKEYIDQENWHPDWKLFIKTHQ